MDNNFNYETYIYISSKELTISVSSNLDNEIYHAGTILEDNFKADDLEKLDFFLNENIYKIEKKIKNFIQNVSLIIDLDVFFPIDISIKKNNYGEPISLKLLHHLLHDAKDYCKKTLGEKKIVHMLIVDYLVDNKSHSFLPKDIKCNSFSLNLKFLCISNLLIRDFEKILKRYQISLDKVMSANYLREYSHNQEEKMFLTAKKINNGHNPNEVVLVNKTRKNQGFFERFFSYFS